MAVGRHGDRPGSSVAQCVHKHMSHKRHSTGHTPGVRLLHRSIHEARCPPHRPAPSGNQIIAPMGPLAGQGAPESPCSWPRLQPPRRERPAQALRSKGPRWPWPRRVKRQRGAQSHVQRLLRIRAAQRIADFIFRLALRRLPPDSKSPTVRPSFADGELARRLPPSPVLSLACAATTAGETIPAAGYSCCGERCLALGSLLVKQGSAHKGQRYSVGDLVQFAGDACRMDTGQCGCLSANSRWPARLARCIGFADWSLSVARSSKPHLRSIDGR